MTKEQIAEMRAWAQELCDPVSLTGEQRLGAVLARLLDEREALLEALRLALSSHLHPFGDHTADACGMCENFRTAIAKAEAE